MGFEPHQPPSCFKAVNEFTDQMKNTLEEAKSALAKAKDDLFCKPSSGMYESPSH